MENNSQSRPQLVKTPVLDIPLGEPIVSDDGYHYGLKIKKPKENAYENVWLDQLIGMVATAVQPKE